MEEVILLPSVNDKLKNLVFVLYKKEYFSFLESAEKYVNNIYDFIYAIPTLQHKPTKNKNYGEYYCRYRHNKNTTWYITFDHEDDLYLIKNITNNHSKDYSSFMEEL
ncbi:MAG: hypothetical protein ABIN25_14060 [Ginsengibacter sp.]